MKIRFCFDPWAGECLWAGDDEALEAYDYPIQPCELPLSADLVTLGEELIQRIQTATLRGIRGKPLWSQDDALRFNQDCQQFLEQLQAELGPRFEIVVEWVPEEGLPDWKGAGW